MHSDLESIKKLVYDKYGFDFENLIMHLEGEAYGACSFSLNGYKIEHRVSKITPTKIGQFVFSKKVLISQDIISKNEVGGKRGIRVYPSWDIAPNKQAEKTQKWQLNYFFMQDTFPINLANYL